MEHYTKGEAGPLEEIEEPCFKLHEQAVHMTVNYGSKIRNLMGFALKKMQEPTTRQIVWTGSGSAVAKTISCAETLKQKIKMPRFYKKVVSSKKRRYNAFSEEDMAKAKAAVNGGMSLRKAADKYGVSKSTLERACHGKQHKMIGGQTVFTELEESLFCKYVTATGDWGFPFSLLDLRLVVKSYLDRTGRTVIKFKENIPGEEWALGFVHPHEEKIGRRTCQNIKSSRAGVQKEEFIKYFENLKDAIDGIPPENILNYDETNLSDDPGTEKLIFKRGTKYPEHILNYTKGATSIMFAGTAAGELLPVRIFLFVYFLCEPFNCYLAELRLKNMIKEWHESKGNK